MKHFPFAFGAAFLLVAQLFCVPCVAQMSTGSSVHLNSVTVEDPAPRIIVSNAQSLRYTEQISEAQEKWQLATKRKWLGFGIGTVTAIALFNEGPSPLVAGGYLAGGVLSLVGMIGEEIQKHRYARAVRKQFESLASEMSQSQTPSRGEEQSDILLPPPNYRPSTLDDLKSGKVVWFKEGDSLVLAVGQIVSTSSRGSRVYVTVKKEQYERTLPMGDIFIPL